MQLEQYQDLHNKWLAAAESFLEQAPDDEASSVLQFIRENGILAAPTPQGIRSLERVRTKDYVVLLHLQPDDAATYPGLARMVLDGATAQFIPSKRLLIFRQTASYSDVWRAVLLLHEGRHACSVTMTHADHDDPVVIRREERDTHAYQNRLIERYAGPKYRAFIEGEAKRLVRQTVRRGGKPGSMFLSSPVNVDALDEFLGPANSAEEKSSRQAYLLIHVAFHIIERFYKGDVAEQQARYYEWYSKWRLGGNKTPAQATA